jgi:hypothetical protein
MLCKHRFPCNTLTHSINEDLLNIKRKGDPEVLYPLSYVRYHWNPEPMCNKSHLFFNLFNLFWHTDKIFCFYAEVNFWDFVRNDNSNKGTTARLNETRFGPKNKSSPIYLGPKNLDTFWGTGWAWNCQIIFRCASIHGRAGFILSSRYVFSCVICFRGIHFNLISTAHALFLTCLLVSIYGT